MDALSTEWQKSSQAVNNFMEKYLQEDSLLAVNSKHQLKDSLLYSIQTGGKRFRPFLSYLVAKALQKPERQVLAFAAAVEIVHTFSLIHDDLPALDNDDLRRGKPTNHKVFGEALALLAGDALLSESFAILAKYYEENPALALQLVKDLADAVGPKGMILGQVLDIQENPDLTFEQMQTVHHLKTGALIQVSVLGAAKICQATPAQITAFKDFSTHLGIAFQIQDDLHDYLEGKKDKISYAKFLGVETAEQELANHSQKAKAALASFGASAELLASLVDFNQSRSI